MRRQILLAAASAVAVTAIPAGGYAQSRRDPDADQRRQQEDAAKKRRQREEWGDVQAPLPALRNAGPCPYVKVLYDASRYVDFKDAREAANAVAYTGEFQSLSSGCSYKDEEPISVRIEMLMGFGKGPQATGNQHTYRYWVAVTQRNQQVLAKEYFDVPVGFDVPPRMAAFTRDGKRFRVNPAAVTAPGAPAAQ